MLVVPHAFEHRNLVGGHVVLDLLNTVTARNAEPRDWLDGYPRLLEWAALTGDFDGAVLRALARRRAADPRAGALALRRVKELRETLVEILVALVGGASPPAGALDRLEAHWRRAAAHARLALVDGHLRLQVGVETSGLDYLAHELTLRAVELLATLPLERTRICRGERCGWLFLDSSKAGKRRWCDMAVCGNAAKSKRYQQRQRRAATGRQPE